MEPLVSAVHLPVPEMATVNDGACDNVTEVKQEPEWQCDGHEWHTTADTEQIDKSGMPADIGTGVKTEVDTHTDEGVATFYNHKNSHQEESDSTKSDASYGK